MQDKDGMSEADLLYVVRKLRTYVNSLDNLNFLSSKLKWIGDSNLIKMADRAAAEFDSVATSAANLLKHIEQSDAYNSIVARFRSKDYHPEEEDDA